MRGSSRCLVVTLIVCSWLAISNHCAIAGLAPKTEATQSECPFHQSKPAKPKSQPAGIQCCKVLRAVVATAAKNWARDDAKFSHVDLPIEKLVLLSTGYRTAPLLLDTGPPEAHSFAELILQESVLAHAPPAGI